MTEEQLNELISKKEKVIEKVEKRIKKWSSGMPEEAIQKCAACELTYDDPKLKDAVEAWKEHEKTHPDNLFNDEYWNRGPNYHELYSAYRDLAEQKAILNKYKVQLQKETNFKNMEKIEVIWNFLQRWKENAISFFNQNAEEYAELRKNKKEAFKEFLKSEGYEENAKLGWRESYRLDNKFEKEYFRNIHSLTKSLCEYSDKIDPEKLNKILDKEVQYKYLNLVNTITEKAGEIIDASDLHIGNKGDINGFVQGSKNKVHVETIGAGGYNIQIYHYRTLVHVVK